MQTLKSVFGLTRAILPVIYFGGLAYFLFDVSGSMENVNAIGLGPTVVDLSAVGLIFCIPVILKLGRLYSASRSPGSGGGKGLPPDDQDGFDPDAAIARYMAQRPVEAVPNAPAARPAQKSVGQTRPSGFGRRNR